MLAGTRFEFFGLPNSLLASGKVNIKLMKNYKVKLTKKFNIDFPITGILKPAIGFSIFYFQFLLIYLLIYKMAPLFL